MGDTPCGVGGVGWLGWLVCLLNQPTNQLTTPNGIYRTFFKRPMDIILSLLAIIFLSPILLIVAILVRLKLGRPIIFKQQRPGLNEKIFTMYKFRTMTDEKGENGELLPDSIRLTKFGRILRSTSLDELPQLFNILKGEMSFVGPRPLIPNEGMINVRRKELNIDRLRPGLTGWAQVKARDTCNDDEKLELDLYYSENVSFILDFKILMYTFSVLKGK